MTVSDECIAFAQLQSEPTVLVGAGGEMLFANAAFGELLDRSCADLAEGTLSGFGDGDSVQLDRVLAECTRTSGAVPGVLGLVSSSGAVVQFHFRAIQLGKQEPRMFALLRTAECTVECTAECTAEDTAERTATNAAETGELRERVFAEGVFQTVGALVAVLDPTGYIERVNKAFERVAGYTADELRGKLFWEVLTDSENRGRAQQMVRDVAECTGPIAADSVLLTKSGQRRRISWSNACLCDQNDGVEFLVFSGLDVTERVAAERQRAALARELSALAAASSVGLFHVDVATGMTWGSPQAEQLAGVDLQGQPSRDHWLNALHPDDRQRVVDAWNQSLSHNLPFESEYRFLHSDGSIVWVLGQANTEHNADGAVTGYAGTLTNITAHKDAEQALRASEERFRAYIDKAPRAIYIADANGTCLEANQPAADLAGYPLDQMRGLGLMAQIHPHFHAAILDDLSKVIAGERVSGEYRALRADGSGYWLAVDAAPLSSDRVIAFSRDVTERRSQVAELRRLTAAMAQLSEGIVVTDLDGVIEYVNPAFERITGYAAVEVLGKAPSLLKGNKHDVAFYQKLWATISSGEVWAGRFHNRRKDGTVYPEDSTISPVRSESGAIVAYVNVKRDVSEELRVAEELRQAQRMEAVGQLAGGVAHDFNNLLTVIRTCCVLMEQSIDDNDPLREDLDDISGAAERAEVLTRQLLAFSRRQLLRPRVLALNELVSELFKMLGRLIGEDVELRRELCDGATHVEVDPGQLEQVILNLAVNSRDAMPTGGVFTISTTIVQVSANSNDANLAPGRYVRLSVCDTGEGMTDEVVGQAFEPFFTTKGPGKGTGLGLSTVHGIVKQSGGHIAVESVVGKGTSVHIYLLTTMVQDEPIAVVSSSQTAGTETILVVEDDAVVRRITARILEREGYQVLQACDGTEAVAMIGKAPPFELLLSDVVMPGLSGPEVAAAFCAHDPSLKVLFMSGYTDDKLSHHGVVDYAKTLLLKPFTPQALAIRVRQVLDDTD